jgi:hypothetical protein
MSRLFLSRLEILRIETPGQVTEGCGPLTCTPRGGAARAGPCTAAEMKAGASCQGIEASHSLSYYWRVWCGDVSCVWNVYKGVNCECVECV